MDINIRQAVLNNLNKADHDTIRSTIQDAMQINEEKVLPGLGVLFEVVWNNTSDDQKNFIIETIAKAVS